MQCYADFEADLLRWKIIQRNVYTAVAYANIHLWPSSCYLAEIFHLFQSWRKIKYAIEQINPLLVY